MRLAGSMLAMLGHFLRFCLTPSLFKTLRRWHADKLDRLDMKEKYVEFLQGKTRRTIIRRHYSDYSTERLKRIYDRAGLKVLTE